MAPTIRFSASRDWLTRIVTAIVLLAVTASATFMAWAGSSSASPARWLLFVLAGLQVLLLLTLAAFVPLGYRVGQGAIWVERPLRAVRIPLRGVRDVRPLELHRVLRAMGVGGFFGAWGWFTSRELPWFRAYVTRRQGLICIDRDKDRPVVLSPDDVTGFVDEARRQLAEGQDMDTGV